MSNKPKILILSSSLFTDRTLLYSTMAPYLVQRAKVEVWVSSLPANAQLWQQKGYLALPFPKVNDFKERLNLLREINHTAWAYALPAPAILGMRRFNKKNLNLPNNYKYWHFFPFITFWIGRLLGFLRLHRFFEQWLMKKTERANRSTEAAERLRQLKPDLLVTTGPMWLYDAAVCIEARQQGIPIFSFIPSWDNITTKSRFTYYSNAYGVWSNVRTQELHKYYPYTKTKKVYPVGAPQYDVFFEEKYRVSRSAFCQSYGLNSDLPIVLWGLGSPIFIKSEFESGFYALQKMRQTKQLDSIQVLVRPHPNKDNWEMFDALKGFHPNVVLQQITQEGVNTAKRSQTEVEIADWINTILHCDVILNMTSTILLDGVFFDKPSVNIAYDDTPGAVYDAFLKSINATWPHVNSVVRSDASEYADNTDELISAIFDALQQPEKKRNQRKQLWIDIVNNPNGRAGEAMAMAILQTAKDHQKQIK
ncbi:MAG: hypothetical protein EAY75_08245 [Bacteroidetes bacterium]|nr:MAG: hypothetical protein EAY75_08245 [Bacteroidota bacterium]